MENKLSASAVGSDVNSTDMPTHGFVARLFRGPDGLRAGWRVLTFFVVLIASIWSLILAIRVMLSLIHFQRSAVTAVITPGRALLNESVILVGLFITTAIFARTERRSFAEYGLPAKSAFGAKFWEGLVWGFAAMSGILLVLPATGNFHFGTISLSAGKIGAFAAVWSLYFVLVGVAEEFAFRGYPLFTLARGMGFWPAAGLMALLFGAVHLLNSGENWIGAASIVMSALLLALTLLRTGNLWFAIGLHTAWGLGGKLFLWSPRQRDQLHRPPAQLIISWFKVDDRRQRRSRGQPNNAAWICRPPDSRSFSISTSACREVPSGVVHLIR